MDGTKSGFFLNFYQNTRNNLKSDEIQTFISLANNQERFQFANRVTHVDEKLGLKRHERDSKLQVNKDEIHFYKDQNCALEMKKIGNKFFQSQQWNDALNFYNKSYIMFPSECCKWIGLKSEKPTAKRFFFSFQQTTFPSSSPTVRQFCTTRRNTMQHWSRSNVRLQRAIRRT